MTVGFEDANLFVFEGFDQRQATGRDRDHLTRHRLPIFHARGSDILMRDFQAAGQMADKLFGRQFPFFDPQKEEFTAFFGGIGRNLFNKEIFGMNFA